MLQIARGNRAVHLATGAHLRQHAARNAEQRQEFIIPVQRVDVVEHGAAGVAGVGDKHLALGQIPDEPGINRAEAELAALRPLARILDIIENPLDLGRGKISVNDEPGLAANPVALVVQTVAILGGAAVLPDDGIAHRLAGGAVPDDGGLALVGHADGGDILRFQPGLGKRFGEYRNLRAPNLLRIVLDPTRRRKMLGKRLLGDADRLAMAIENNRARGRRPLVKRHDELILHKQSSSEKQKTSKNCKRLKVFQQSET